jgi:protein TonB
VFACDHLDLQLMRMMRSKSGYPGSNVQSGSPYLASTWSKNQLFLSPSSTIRTAPNRWRTRHVYSYLCLTRTLEGRQWCVCTRSEAAVFVGMDSRGGLLQRNDDLARVADHWNGTFEAGLTNVAGGRRGMFDTITRRPSDIATKNRVLTTIVAVLAHVAILTALILVPIWYFTPVLPRPSEIMAFVAAPPLPPPPPPAAAPARQARHEPVKATSSPDRYAAPIEVPSRIEPETRADTRGTTGVPGGVEGGIEGGVVGGIVGGLSSALPPPPPPVPPPAKPALVRIGGQIKAPALISRINPVYPALAQAAQLEGIVILEATVGETGWVESVKVLRSVGLLDAAAVEAVKQWRYSPLRLNDRPTSFVLTVTVQFHLGNRAT